VIAFLSTEARERRRAVEALGGEALADPAVRYALRRLLAMDEYVAVRAAAADALGRRVRRAVDEAADDAVNGAADDAADDVTFPALLEALDDVSPVVRDAAIRALARRRASGALGALRERAEGDLVWWVRRAAVYAIGVIAATAQRRSGGASDGDGDGDRASLAIEVARSALRDPFWRVRHAAVQVLTVCGNRAPERRDEILARVEGGSGDYLRALWGPTLVEDPQAPEIASRLPEPLRDRDPAVVTARLAAMEAPPAVALVELLCDPHVPLRELAAARLVASGDVEAYAAALRWLDEPRIPHVATTVIELMDRLGEIGRAHV
jgi:HEAT repeat protein